MSRTIWKGAISFGLLNAPVAMHAATQQDEIDFDWLQRDTLKPVGYKRVVKDTGKEVDKDDIVRAVKYEGEYVVLSEEEIQSANVKSTHTIEILSFTDAADVNFLFFETPYYLAPAKGGEKVYTLLREALLKSRVIGLAQVVMHNKQHLAALIATEQAIVLNTLRWADEVRGIEDLDLPEKGLRTADIKPKELTMATQLIESMTEAWDPTQYRDTFRDDVMALVKKKHEEGMARQITEVKVEAPEETADTADLMELLRQSLQGNGRRSRRKEEMPPPPSARKPTRVRASKSVH
jgi:DNA end-binding protein Ku